MDNTDPDAMNLLNEICFTPVNDIKFDRCKSSGVVDIEGQAQVYISTSIFTYLLIYLFIYLLIYLFIYLFIFLYLCFFCICILLSTYLFVYIFI